MQNINGDSPSPLVQLYNGIKSMPIEVGIWKLGKHLEKVSFSSIESECQLEDTLAHDISIISPELMLIVRQIPTAFGKFIDLIAMDVDVTFIIKEKYANG